MLRCSQSISVPLLIICLNSMFSTAAVAQRGAGEENSAQDSRPNASSQKNPYDQLNAEQLQERVKELEQDVTRYRGYVQQWEEKIEKAVARLRRLYEENPDDAARSASVPGTIAESDPMAELTSTESLSRHISMLYDQLWFWRKRAFLSEIRLKKAREQLAKLKPGDSAPKPPEPKTESTGQNPPSPPNSSPSQGSTVSPERQERKLGLYREQLEKWTAHFAAQNQPAPDWIAEEQASLEQMQQAISQLEENVSVPPTSSLGPSKTLVNRAGQAIQGCTLKFSSLSPDGTEQVQVAQPDESGYVQLPETAHNVMVSALSVPESTFEQQETIPPCLSGTLVLPEPIVIDPMQLNQFRSELSPHIDQLLRQTGSTKDHLLLMVTPRIIIQEEAGVGSARKVAKTGAVDWEQKLPADADLKEPLGGNQAQKQTLQTGVRQAAQKAGLLPKDGDALRNDVHFQPSNTVTLPEQLFRVGIIIEVDAPLPESEANKAAREVAQALQQAQLTPEDVTDIWPGRLQDLHLGAFCSLPPLIAIRLAPPGRDAAQQQPPVDPFVESLLVGGRAGMNLVYTPASLGSGIAEPDEYLGSNPPSMPPPGMMPESIQGDEQAERWGRFWNTLQTVVETEASESLRKQGNSVLRNASVIVELPTIMHGDVQAPSSTQRRTPPTASNLNTALVPDDPFFNSAGTWGQRYPDQWALKRIGCIATGGEEASAWPAQWPEIYQRLQPCIVAVIGSGVDWTHPELTYQMWMNLDEIPHNGRDDDNNGYIDDVHGWNFRDRNSDVIDYGGHDTHIAGIIAADWHNGYGIAGINPSAQIMALKVADFTATADSNSVTDAIIYAVNNGAKVINLSYSGPAQSRLQQAAIDYAIAKGVLIVVSSGNKAEDVSGVGPAGQHGVLTVGGTTIDDQRAGFSNWGQTVSIAAPSTDVLSLRAHASDFLLYTGENPNYKGGSAIVGDDREFYRAGGTSFAAPMVAGTASLLWSLEPELTLSQVVRKLLMSARDVEMPGWDQYTGAGVVDARQAIKADPDHYLFARITQVQPVRSGGELSIEVQGVAVGSEFQGRWLQIGFGENPRSDDWTTVGYDRRSGSGGVLGTIPLRRFDRPGIWTVRLLTQDQRNAVRSARARINLE